MDTSSAFFGSGWTVKEWLTLRLHNRPFAAEQSHGTKLPNCRANDTLGHQISVFFVQHVPVHHLLSSLVPRDCSAANGPLWAKLESMQPVPMAGYSVFAPVELDGTHSWLVTEAIFYDKIIMCSLQTTLTKLLALCNETMVSETLCQREHWFLPSS